VQIVGSSPVVRSALQAARRAAQSPAAVLLCGETGTGKELFARAIHHLSSRASGPYVPVNCGALSGSLLMDELFGHEAGAFTDARTARPGLLEQASGGTLFLDEVDALSTEAQVALLRVTEGRKLRRIGSSGETAFDVRIVAATHVDLEQLVRDGRFREDLYYRLAVLVVDLPPLRERRDDIPDLCRHFAAGRAPDRTVVFSPEALAYLTSRPWPGNVRELDNAIQRALAATTGDLIDLCHVISTSPADRAPTRLRAVREAAERDYLTRSPGWDNSPPGWSEIPPPPFEHAITDGTGSHDPQFRSQAAGGITPTSRLLNRWKPQRRAVGPNLLHPRPDSELQ
jgi:DNA-binding NtrC family response regulator